MPELTEQAGASPEVLVVKNLPANARNIRDAGLIPGSGSSPRGGHGNPLQYSFFIHACTWRESRVQDRSFSVPFLSHIYDINIYVCIFFLSLFNGREKILQNLYETHLLIPSVVTELFLRNVRCSRTWKCDLNPAPIPERNLKHKTNNYC